MRRIRKWRWALAVGFPIVAGGLLAWSGIVRLNYEGEAFLAFAGKSNQVEEELKMFQFHPVVKSSMDRVPGDPRRLSIRVEGYGPNEALQHLAAAAQRCVDRSFARKKNELDNIRAEYQKKGADLDAPYHRLMEDRKTLFADLRPNASRAKLIAQIEELKTRRQALIENYPSHTDIPVLAKKIQALLKQLDRPSRPKAEKIFELDRQINETKLRMDYFARRAQEADKTWRGLKPLWTIVQPIKKPMWPNRIEGWPWGIGVFAGLLGLGRLVFRKPRDARSDAVDDGLWKPAPLDIPVALRVVATEPKAVGDPLTGKAAALYAKWVEMARILYTPAPEPPQGVLDQVAPLLQESSDFLPEGRDVLARYLAKSVTPGDLAAHVARTVLMTLTGAEEAGVSPEHRLAMALAALFHDLAVVPRPPAFQEEVGSEVGRLSAGVLRRIPGLPPALLAMVEDILIGMDEFKLETWQNVANGNNLEPLSKVLREIDRFEKVMQKQKARLDRRVANS